MSNDMLRQPSMMQFGIRGLAITMTLVAILSAVVSPWVQSLEAPAQRYFVLGVVLYAAGLLAGLSSQCFMRYRLEQRCGYRHLTIRCSPLKHRLWLRTALVFACLMGFFSGATFTFAEDAADFGLSGTHIPLLYGFGSAVLVIAMWWQQSSPQLLEICDHGLIFSGISFRPWHDFKYYRWTTAQRLMLQEKSQALFVRIPREMRDPVDQLFRRFLPCEQGAHALHSAK